MLHTFVVGVITVVLCVLTGASLYALIGVIRETCEKLGIKLETADNFLWLVLGIIIVMALIFALGIGVEEKWGIRLWMN